MWERGIRSLKSRRAGAIKHCSTQILANVTRFDWWDVTVILFTHTVLKYSCVALVFNTDHYILEGNMVLLHCCLHVNESVMKYDK